VEKRWYLTPEDIETAARKGIAKTTVYSRVYRLDWDVDKAITKSTRHKYSAAQKQLMIDNNISVDTLEARLRLGMSFDEAVTRPIKLKENNSKYFTPDECKRLKETGIGLSTAISRKRRGWSDEKIFNKPSRKAGVRA
jgi:hypothetical protein